MANIWEKAKSILSGNLNSGLSHLITTVWTVCRNIFWSQWVCSLLSLRFHWFWNFPQIRYNLNENELDGNVLVKFETNGEIQVQSESFGETLEMITFLSYENNI